MAMVVRLHVQLRSQLLKNKIMENFYSNLRKKRLKKQALIFGLPISIIIIILIIFQGQIFKVSAQIVPVTVNVEHLDFGTVFPGEELEGNFIVTYADTGDGIAYRIVQERKPLPPEHPEYPDGGDPEMPGYYRNLCSHLTKVKDITETDQDTENSAFVGPEDISDTWIIYFEVPAIFGNVAQDHIGSVIDENGEYGCDISIGATEAFVIDTVVVPSDGSVVNSNVTLENGKQYLFEAIGTYRFVNWGDYGIADAEYAYRNDSYSLPVPSDGWTLGEDSYPSVVGLDVQVDGNNVYWGDYSTEHVYAIPHTGADSAIGFSIYDSYYGDNSGSITIKIYQLP